MVEPKCKSTIFVFHDQNACSHQHVDHDDPSTNVYTGQYSHTAHSKPCGHKHHQHHQRIHQHIHSKEYGMNQPSSVLPPHSVIAIHGHVFPQIFPLKIGTFRRVIEMLYILIVCPRNIGNDSFGRKWTSSILTTQRMLELGQHIVICSNDSLLDVIRGTVVEDIFGNVVSAHLHISQHPKPTDILSP